MDEPAVTFTVPAAEQESLICVHVTKGERNSHLNYSVTLSQYSV